MPNSSRFSAGASPGCGREALCTSTPLDSSVVASQQISGFRLPPWEPSYIAPVAPPSASSKRRDGDDGLDERPELPQEPGLSRQDPPLRLGDGKPGRAIHLGEFAHRARSRRPLHVERAAPQPRRVPIAPHRPGTYDLASLLPQRTERRE